MADFRATQQDDRSVLVEIRGPDVKQGILLPETEVRNLINALERMEDFHVDTSTL